MLCPTRNDPAYKHFKKLQKKHPGVDITQAVADALVNATTEAEEIAKAKARSDKAKAAEEAAELAKMEAEEAEAKKKAAENK